MAGKASEIDDVLRVGVDVGGTNTDAAVLCGNCLISSIKITTSEDIMTGVSNAIKASLESIEQKHKNKKLFSVNIGTTHFVNAVIQRKNLVKVAVIRLCGPASRSLPPLVDFPEDLAEKVDGNVYLLNGGFQFDGQSITDIDRTEILHASSQIKQSGVKNIVISGVFSPVNPCQEREAAEIVRANFPEASVTLSHLIGQIGLLERENAAVLNECLKPLSRITVDGFYKALLNLGLDCPFFLTQNDGTLISADDTLEYPVRTFASGPTNSMRGAAFLAGIKNCIVIDIGGTTTDVGVLSKGFPRQASSKVTIGGVHTNFRMPDVLSIGLGGGSIVRELMSPKARDSMFLTNPIKVGPQSVGYKLTEEAIIFGGSTLTATDVAVKSGLVVLGESAKVQHIHDNTVEFAMKEIREMVESSVDQVKISSCDQPVVLVGGGSILIDAKRSLKGASKVIKPPHFEVANAVGAALSQISGNVDHVVFMAQVPRDKAIESAKAKARQCVLQAGAHPDSVDIVEVTETPLAYLVGEAVRLQVKAVGDLLPMMTIQTEEDETDAVDASTELNNNDDEDEDIIPDSLIQSFNAGRMDSPEVEYHEHNIDYTTGEWLLNNRDIECISIGAAILGCGGGGSPYLAKLRALKALKDGKIIKVIHPSRLGTTPELDGYVTMVGFMGAPLIVLEKLISGCEICDSVNLIQDILQSDTDCIKADADGNKVLLNEDDIKQLKFVKEKKIVALMSAEIGGLNAVEPLAFAAEMGLPVVDCDGMGRAFPGLQMVLPSIKGLPVYPATLVDDKGRRAAYVDGNKTAKDLEDFFRDCVVKMGCSGGTAMSVFSAADIKENTILYSISRAWRLGDAVFRAREMKVAPASVLIKSCSGKRLIHGKVSDVSRKTLGGFNFGKLIIEGFGRFQGSELIVNFQNENLIARQRVSGSELDGDVVATTPDLISVLDADSGEPIVTEEVRYGLRVVVLAMPSAPAMRTKEALKVVGPQVFGYDDVHYIPLPDYIAYKPIPPAPLPVKFKLNKLM